MPAHYYLPTSNLFQKRIRSKFVNHMQYELHEGSCTCWSRTWQHDQIHISKASHGKVKSSGYDLVSLLSIGGARLQGRYASGLKRYNAANPQIRLCRKGQYRFSCFVFRSWYFGNGWTSIKSWLKSWNDRTTKHLCLGILECFAQFGAAPCRLAPHEDFAGCQQTTACSWDIIVKRVELSHGHWTVLYHLTAKRGYHLQDTREIFLTYRKRYANAIVKGAFEKARDVVTIWRRCLAPRHLGMINYRYCGNSSH